MISTNVQQFDYLSSMRGNDIYKREGWGRGRGGDGISKNRLKAECKCQAKKFRISSGTVENPRKQLAWVSGYHRKFQLKPYVEVSLRTFTTSTIMRSPCKLRVGLPPLQSKYYFILYPLFSFKQPPSILPPASF